VEERDRILTRRDWRRSMQRLGESVVVGGVDPAWKTGPDGCVSSSFFIATPPLA
jgi:hypothetical protein